MERHQAGQKETLMEVMVGTDSLEVFHQPRGSPADRRGCFKCVVALAAVMGLVIGALMVGFILYFYMFTPSCNQDTGTAKHISCELKETDEHGRYDIFTVDKAATYLIYGWVSFPEATSKEFTLLQMSKEDKRTIETKNGNGTEIFFFAKVKPVNGVTISIYFDSAPAHSCFHIYKL